MLHLGVVPRRNCIFHCSSRPPWPQQSTPTSTRSLHGDLEWCLAPDAGWWIVDSPFTQLSVAYPVAGFRHRLRIRVAFNASMIGMRNHIIIHEFRCSLIILSVCKATCCCLHAGFNQSITWRFGDAVVRMKWKRQKTFMKTRIMVVELSSTYRRAPLCFCFQHENGGWFVASDEMGDGSQGIVELGNQQKSF